MNIDITEIISLLTLSSHPVLVILGILLLTHKSSFSTSILKIIQPLAEKLALIVTIIAVSFSLFLSEVLGFAPCTLCWYQRIFLYPQVIILGLGLILKDQLVNKYCLVLSVIGGVIAGYHYLVQLNLVPSLPCTAVGLSISCSQRFIFSYGYITIPLMALTAFILISLFLILSRLKLR